MISTLCLNNLSISAFILIHHNIYWSHPLVSQSNPFISRSHTLSHIDLIFLSPGRTQFISLSPGAKFTQLATLMWDLKLTIMPSFLSKKIMDHCLTSETFKLVTEGTLDSRVFKGEASNFWWTTFSVWQWWRGRESSFSPGRRPWQPSAWYPAWDWRMCCRSTGVVMSSCHAAIMLLCCRTDAVNRLTWQPGLVVVLSCHCNAFSNAFIQGIVRPDPFYVDQAINTLEHLIEMGIPAVCNSWLTLPPCPDIVSIDSLYSAASR